MTRKRGFDMIVKENIMVNPPRCNDEALDLHELRNWMETSADLGLGDTSETPVAHEIHSSGFFRGVKVGLMLAGGGPKRKGSFE
jgi:hypothetical protein